MEKGKLFYRAICLLLTLAIFSSLVLTASAENDVITLSVSCGQTVKTLGVTQENGQWYGSLRCLAGIAGCQFSVNREQNTVTLYIKEPLVILYSLPLGDCVEHSGEQYVPLQEASVAAGIQFLGTDPICARVYRTPKQMLAEFDDIYYDQRYQITQLLLVDGYWIAESAARLYAIMPFVGSGSLVGALSGADEMERYRRAFTSILTNNGNMSDLLASVADVSSEIQRNGKMLKWLDKVLAKDGKLYDTLLSKGVDRKLLDTFATERTFYNQTDYLFQDWTDVLTTINFDHFLDVMSFYAVSADTEASTLIAMKNVFYNSDNPRSSYAAAMLFDMRYGQGVGVIDVYSDLAWDIAEEACNKRVDEYIYGGEAALTGLLANLLDMHTQASSKSEAFMYFPIYASIQQDLYDYYVTHRNDTQEHTMEDLRAVTVMYLRSAIAAYEYAAFDADLAQTLEYANTVLNDELANVLSYSQWEYEPAYTNQELIDWLNSHCGTQTAPTQPATDTTAPTQSVGGAIVLVGTWIQEETVDGHDMIHILRLDENGEAFYGYGWKESEFASIYTGTWYAEGLANLCSIGLELSGGQADGEGESGTYSCYLSGSFSEDRLYISSVIGTPPPEFIGWEYTRQE